MKLSRRQEQKPFKIMKLRDFGERNGEHDAIQQKDQFLKKKKVEKVMSLSLWVLG